MEGKLETEALASYIERIENLENQRALLAGDIKDILTEAQSTGFDAKIMRKVIKIRQIKPEDRQAQDELLNIYMLALGEK